MKTYLVQLESHDDVISARDKISWSKARRVLLVWPRKGKILERRIDLLLLQRHAQQTGAQIAIVTRSGEVLTHARDLGIPVFSKTEHAQQVLWRRARRRKLPRPINRPESIFNLRQQRAALTSGYKPGIFVRLVAFMTGLLALTALVLLFLPGAEIQIKPRQAPQQLTITVWAGPQIPVPNPSGGLPAQVLSVVVEGRDQAYSSGSTRTADRPAAGEVQLTNLTDQPVEVPAGSVVVTLSSPPVQFALTQSVLLPPGPGTQANAKIQAVIPGRTGNLAEGQIRAMEGPIGLRLAVENLSATQGGSDRVSPAPTAADYRALHEKLLTSLEATARDELQERVKPGQYLLIETLRLNEVLEESREPAESQPGDRLQLAMRVEYQALLVSEEDLQIVAQAALEANPAPGYRAVPGSLRIEFASQPRVVEVESEDAESSQPQQARWDLLVEHTLEAAWSEAALVQELKGRTFAEAAEILQARLPLSEPPRILISPVWWSRLPYLPFRIAVVQI